MADIVKCKICAFIAFYIQMSGHFKLKHPDLDYYENTEKLGDSDSDLKKYGFRPSIEYYRAKFKGELAGRDPFDFERTFRTRS